MKRTSLRYSVAGLALAFVTTFSPAQTKKPAAGSIIFSNLGVGSNAYDPNDGYVVAGRTNGQGDAESWVGAAFTPTQNVTVGAIELGLTWFSGTNEALVAIYDGATGKPISTAALVQDLPTYGTCCTVTEVRIAPTNLTAGQTYFVGVSADDDLAPDFFGIFNGSPEANLASSQNRQPWKVTNLLWPAMAVFGTPTQ